METFTLTPLNALIIGWTCGAATTACLWVGIKVLLSMRKDREPKKKQYTF